MGRTPLSAGLADLAEAACRAGRDAGLAAVGIATAEPFGDARRVIEQRRAAGLHAGMAFTYRNPDRSCDPARALAGVRRLVVGARAYAVADPPRPVRGGPWARVARYARHDDYAELRAALGAVAAVLRGRGHRAVVVADDNALVDRAAAVRAGLGWFGKSANVLVPGAGSWVVLGAVLTDAALPVTARPQPDGCGPCRRCLDGCPVHAIRAPGVVDARRCLAWMLQVAGPFPRAFRVALGDRLYGCDDCQEVCPASRRDTGPAAPAPPLGPGAWVDLCALLRASDSELLGTFGRWYLPRRQPRYLRRNALVVLGNVGEGHDVEVVTTLRASLVAGDPLVRSHAVWAAVRLGRRDLVAGMGGDPDPLVRAEYVLAPTVPSR